MRLLLNKYFNNKFLLILILNAIYVLMLKMNLLSSNILEIKHDFCINLDNSSKSSQILKEEIVIERLIYYNNLYLINLANTNIMMLLLQIAITSKKLIFL
jgi:hypothetical protein